MSKGTVWRLCDQTQNKEGAQRRQETTTIVTVRQYALCALQIFGIGSFQVMAATGRYSAVSYGPF